MENHKHNVNYITFVQSSIVYIGISTHPVPPSKTPSPSFFPSPLPPLNQRTVQVSSFLGIVCIGVSTAPSKTPLPSFFLSPPPLNLLTVQVPLFKQSPLYIGFSWPPPPAPKSRIFKIFFILNTILSFKSN